MPPQKLPALSHARLIRVCCKDGYPTSGYDWRRTLRMHSSKVGAAL
jgi:hypothetical protein